MALIGNTVKIEYLRISKVPVDVTKTINPGDMLKWDDVNKFATPVIAADATLASAAAQFIGVSTDAQPIASLKQNVPRGQINVVVKGIVVLTVDDNSTYLPGDGVMIGGGPQLIRKAASNSNTQIIGYVAAENDFDASAGAPAGIVAVANTTQLLIVIAPGIIRMSAFA